MMEDMISKEKLLESFHDIRWKTVNHKRAQAPVTEIYVPWIDVAKRIIKQPTVEAIPVEQVAMMLAKAYANIPCAVFRRKDEWCNERCKVGCMQWECWLHAIREGWVEE